MVYVGLCPIRHKPRTGTAHEPKERSRCQHLSRHRGYYVPDLLGGLFCIQKTHLRGAPPLGDGGVRGKDGTFRGSMVHQWHCRRASTYCPPPPPLGPPPSTNHYFRSPNNDLLGAISMLQRRPEHIGRRYSYCTAAAHLAAPPWPALQRRSLCGLPWAHLSPPPNVEKIILTLST
jgi:hypothetical protein